MKTIIVSVMHGRQETVSYCLNQMPFIEKVMIYSNEADGTFLDRMKIEHKSKFKNYPLAEKWNYAFKFLRNIEFDAVILLGSDDFIDEKFLHFVERTIPNFDIIGFEDIYFKEGRSLYYWPGYDNERKGEPIGAGKVFSRKFLERTNFEMFPGKSNKGIDGVNWRACRNYGAKIHIYSIKRHGLFLCDVKDGKGITKLSNIPNLIQIK